MDTKHPKVKKRKHKILVEVLDEVPSAEEHYLHNMRDELDSALGRVNLKVTWMKVYPLVPKEVEKDES